MSARTSYFSRDEKELLSWLNGREAAGRQVMSVDLPLNYHTILCTPLRVWCSHIFNTPEYDLRAREMYELFTAGVFKEAWAQKPLLVVFNTRMTGPDIPGWVAAHGGILVFSNRTYRVYAMDPVKP